MSRIRVFLIVLAVMLLVSAAVAFYMDVFGVRSRGESALALKGVRVVEGPLETRAVYEYGWFGRTQVSLPIDGALLDYARNGDYEAALVVDESTRNVSVVLLAKDGPRVLVSDAAIKAALDISPDGSTIVYSEMMPQGDQTLSPEEFYAPERWVVRQIDIASGAMVEMGPGFAPRFFTYKGELHLAVTASEGIRIVRSSEGTTDGMLFAWSTDGRRPAVISADGSHIALFEQASESYVLYDLVISEQVEVQEAARFKSKIARVGLEGNYAYMVSVEPGTEPVISLLVVELGSNTEPVNVDSGAELASVFDLLP